MTDTTTITSKGQVTIPAFIRERAGLTAGDRIRFLIDDDGSLIMFPVKGVIKDLKGILPKPKKGLTIEEMNAAIEDAAVEHVMHNARG